MSPTLPLLLLIAATSCPACELCAVYRAAEVRSGARDGFVVSVSEQFVPYRTSQFNGQEVKPANPDRLDTLTTHLVFGYDLSPRFGLSASLPLTHLEFKRTDVRYSLSDPPAVVTEAGSRTGIGDASLISRATVVRWIREDRSVVVNLLAGLKFPTGDSDPIADEMRQTAIFDLFVPPGTPHDPLGHSIAGVHLHSLATGSGSYDGIFGATATASWHRCFFNGQFQYVLSTRGESGFKFGDECLVSGGPGVQLLPGPSRRLSLQALAVYDTWARDDLAGRVSDRTGSTAWYLGPLVSFQWRDRFSSNIGIDLPLWIANNGFQNVPDYRLHGGVSWRF